MADNIENAGSSAVHENNYSNLMNENDQLRMQVTELREENSHLRK